MRSATSPLLAAVLAGTLTMDALRVVKRAAADVPLLPDAGGGPECALRRAEANASLREIVAAFNTALGNVEAYRLVVKEVAGAQRERRMAGIAGELSGLEERRDELEQALVRTKKDTETAMTEHGMLWLRDRVQYAQALRVALDRAVHARRYLYRGPLGGLAPSRFGFMDEMPAKFCPNSRRGLKTIAGETLGPGRETKRERNHTHESMIFGDGSVCPPVLVLPCGDSIPLDVLLSTAAGVRLASTSKGSVISKTCDDIAGHLAEQRGYVFIQRNFV